MAENKITPMRTTSAQIDLVAELRIQNRQLRQIVADSRADGAEVHCLVVLADLRLRATTVYDGGT